MNYYPIGSICEVVDSVGFTELIGEIVTITHNFYTNPGQFKVPGVVDAGFANMGYQVNDGEIIKKFLDAKPRAKISVFTPTHENLRLITPPPEGKGLEMILGMFDKMKVPELA